jgi:hypothetical protein
MDRLGAGVIAIERVTSIKEKTSGRLFCTLSMALYGACYLRFGYIAWKTSRCTAYAAAELLSTACFQLHLRLRHVHMLLSSIRHLLPSCASRVCRSRVLLL